MKTGRAAKMFKVDPKTIMQWTDTFASFFSTGALLSETNKQRIYTPDDLIILNTISAYRGEGLGMDEIRLHLESGKRNATLPVEAAVMGADQSLTIYAQLKQYQTELAETKIRLEESERLRKEDHDEVQKEIIRLNRENAVLIWRLEQMEKDDDE